jgi:DnaJ domain
MAFSPELLADLARFEEAPGRFALAGREPARVFANLHTVLLLAVGRTVEGAALSPEAEARAQRSARAFVRMALLRPGADHYTVLGLMPGFEPATLKDHYRMMIRLTHPDFASAADAWPSDAASRINIANDVLSSPERREAYNAQLAATARPVAPATDPRPAAAAAKVPPTRSPAKPPADLLWTTETSRRAKVAALGLGALAAFVGLLAMSPGDEGASLAVKAPPPAEAAAALALDASPSLKALPPSGNQVADPPPAGKADTRVAAPSAPPGRVPREGTPVATEQAAVRARVPASPASGAVAAGTVDVAPVLRLTEAPTLRPGSPAPAPEPEPPVVVAAVPRPAPAPESAPPPQAPVRPTLKLADAQPVLNKLVTAAQSGVGFKLVRLVDPSWHQNPAASRFVFAYQDELAGYRVAQVQQVNFAASQEGAQLVVTGALNMLLENNQGENLSKTLRMKAYFESRGGEAVLTQLVQLPSGDAR